ncbi:FAD-dependent oxidoreductase [Candidatus Oscillochloris fontis]|uniref:FAD-dependent oxidoreductase n=1 Tax=Candidatus Oscillochloris fontis TaxID=2496868 RepID=UPI00101BB70C|nr:FAD-dependent oxidoreductase [Candidatus Oscillochloris fontis]
MSYDLIVIGAGIGGLTTAALLAHAGRRVLVLEAHIEPGGCASSFLRKRPDGSHYVFDVGATLFGGFQPGGAHDWVAQQLNLRFPVVKLEPAMQVWLPDRVVTRYGDPAAWQEERRCAFPSQAAAAERFWHNQETLADWGWRFARHFPPMPPETPADLIELLPALRPELIGMLPHLERTVAHELHRHRLHDRALRSFIDAQLLISAQVPASEAAWIFGSVALDLARQGVFYVEGGAWTIARTLADGFIRDGGELRYRARVEQILVEGGRAVGVRLAGGEELRAKQIVAGVSVWDVARLLGPHAPRPLQQRIASIPEVWGAFMLYLGVDEAAIPAGLPEHHQVVRNYDAPLGEGNSIFISLHPREDTRRAPVGQRAITISTHTRVGPWWKAHTERSVYDERKAEWAERLLSAAEVVLPNLRQHIRYQQAGSPISFARYTGRERGVVGGLGQRPAQSGFASMGPRVSGVAGLWVVGDSIFPGQSSAAVTQGAIRVARLLRRRGV